MLDTLNQIDFRALLWIQNTLRSGGMTTFWKLITMLGNAGLVWLIADLLLIRKKDTRRSGIICLAALGTAAVLGLLVFKTVIARPRPFVAHPEIQALITESGYSFPSGHSITSFASAEAITKRTGRRYGIPAFVMAAMIAFSRVYLGVHYPGDILGGMLLGIAIAAAVCAVADRRLNRRKAGQTAA